MSRIRRELVVAQFLSRAEWPFEPVEKVVRITHAQACWLFHEATRRGVTQPVLAACLGFVAARHLQSLHSDPTGADVRLNVWAPRYVKSIAFRSAIDFAMTNPVRAGKLLDNLLEEVAREEI